MTGVTIRRRRFHRALTLSSYSASLTSNPDFIAIIERGRTQLGAHRSLSLAEMCRKHGLDQAKKAKARKTA